METADNVSKALDILAETLDEVKSDIGMGANRCCAIIKTIFSDEKMVMDNVKSIEINWKVINVDDVFPVINIEMKD